GARTDAAKGGEVRGRDETAVGAHRARGAALELAQCSQESVRCGGDIGPASGEALGGGGDLLEEPGPGLLAAAAGRADVDAQLVRHETCTAVVKRDSGRPGAQAWHDERDRLQGVEGDLLGVDDVDEDLDRIVEARRSTQ